MAKPRSISAKRRFEINMAATLRGWKNLYKFSPYGMLFMVKALEIAMNAIKDAMVTGRVDNGEPLKKYSKAYERVLSESGQSTIPDMTASGALLRSMKRAVSNEARGRVYFAGGHNAPISKWQQEYYNKKWQAVWGNIATSKTSTPEQKAKGQKMSDLMRGAKTKGLRSQDLADKLAGRRGLGQWDEPGASTPDSPFMEIGSRTAYAIERLYEKMVIEPRLQRLPPMTAMDFDSKIREYLRIEQ